MEETTDRRAVYEAAVALLAGIVEASYDADPAGWRQKAAQREEALIDAMIREETEAAIVQLIFDLYAEGKGLKAIANRINHAGHRTKTGNAFSAVAVGDILDNPAYVGKVRFSFRDKRRRRAETVVTDGRHAAIVDADLWERVRVRRETQAVRPRRVSQRGFPLTGLLRCPACGAGMCMSRTSSTRKDGARWVKYYYACGRWKTMGTAVCHFNGVGADEAEKAVFRRLRRVVTHPTLIRDIVRRVNAGRQDAVRPHVKRLAAVEAERTRQTALQRKYYRLYEQDALAGAELTARLSEIASCVRALEAEESDLRRKIAEMEAAGPVPAEVVHVILEGFVAQLQQADADRQRALLQMLVEEITFERGKGIRSIRLRLSDAVVRALGLKEPAALPSPVSLSL